MIIAATKLVTASPMMKPAASGTMVEPIHAFGFFQPDRQHAPNAIGQCDGKGKVHGKTDQHAQTRDGKKTESHTDCSTSNVFVQGAAP